MSSAKAEIFFALWSASLCSLAGSEACAKPVAILVSGGSRPQSNYLDFVSDLNGMSSSLDQSWRQSTFFSDGSGAAGGAPNATTDSFLGAAPKLFRIEPRVAALGADLALIRAEIIKKVDEDARTGDQSSPFMLYFTDHGYYDESSKKYRIRLWGGADLDEDQLRELIALIPEGHPVYTIHDHCHGAGMFRALRDKNGRLRPGSCGIAAASEPEVASVGQTLARTALELRQKPRNPPQPLTLASILAGNARSQKLNATPVSTSDQFVEEYFNRLRSQSKIPAEFAESLVCVTEKASAEPVALRGLQDELIRQEMKRILAGLRPEIASASLNEQMSVNELDTQLAKASDRLEKFERHADLLRAELNRAQLAYALFKLGQPVMTSFNELTAKVDRIRAELEIADSRKLTGLPHYALEQRLKAAEAARVIEGASSSNSEFNTFVKKYGSPADHPLLGPGFGSMIIRQFLQANRDEDIVQASYSQLKRTARDLKNLIAMRIMSQQAGTGDLADLLGLIQCENTPLNQTKTGM